MKNIYLIAAISIISITSLFAQEKEWVGYSNFGLLAGVNPSGAHTGLKESTGYLGVSIAYRWFKSDVFRQWEISYHHVKEDTEDIVHNYHQFHIRFEMGFRIYQSGDGRFNWYVGPSFRAYYLRQNIDVYPKWQYLKNSTDAGIEYSTNFHVEYYLTKRMSLKGVIQPFYVAIGGDYAKSENPQLSVNQNARGGFDLDIGFLRHARIGLGYKFGPKDVKD